MKIPIKKGLIYQDSDSDYCLVDEIKDNDNVSIVFSNDLDDIQEAKKIGDCSLLRMGDDDNWGHFSSTIHDISNNLECGEYDLIEDGSPKSIDSWKAEINGSSEVQK